MKENQNGRGFQVAGGRGGQGIGGNLLDALGIEMTSNAPSLAIFSDSERVRETRLKRAYIPRRFADARIGDCPDAVREWADSFGPATRSGLVLFGGVGTGKTHAACAALIEVADRATVRFATGSDILRDLRSSYGNAAESEREVVGRYTGPGVLVIDDIGKEQATDWSLSQLFSVVDARHRACRPTIFTCQTTGDDLVRALSVHGDSTTAEAIVDRMRDCRSVAFRGASRRGRQE